MKARKRESVNDAELVFIALILFVGMLNFHHFWFEFAIFDELGVLICFNWSLINNLNHTTPIRYIYANRDVLLW